MASTSLACSNVLDSMSRDRAVRARLRDLTCTSLSDVFPSLPYTFVTCMTMHYIFLSNTTSYDEITFLVLGTYTRYPFWYYGITTKMPRNPFCAWWCMFNVFVSTCAVAFRTTHEQNKTRKCDTEVFVPVASLCGVVGSPSSFIRSLIGRTGKIWSVVYINA